MTEALDRSLAVLACPLCGAALRREERSLRCADEHAFDIARQGYASMTAGGGPHFQGDTADMVAARAALLGAGHYKPIADAIAAAAPPGSWAVELAGGTGYYLARQLDLAPGLQGITLDVSKNAARAAAKAHPRLASITADVRARLPVRSGSVDLALSVFGPRSGGEIARILRPSGSLVVVTPRPAHLGELRATFSLLAIGAEKEDRLDAAVAPLELTSRTDLEYTADLSRADVVSSIMMGPNAFHHPRAEIEALAETLPAVQPTTVAVTVSRFGDAGVA
jgi:23S rRNA (guanine745-N1)-methyltransferase